MASTGFPPSVGTWDLESLCSVGSLDPNRDCVGYRARCFGVRELQPTLEFTRPVRSCIPGDDASRPAALAIHSLAQFLVVPIALIVKKSPFLDVVCIHFAFALAVLMPRIARCSDGCFLRFLLRFPPCFETALIALLSRNEREVASLCQNRTPSTA